MQFYKKIIKVIDQYDPSLTPEEFINRIPNDILTYIQQNQTMVLYNMKRMITESRDEHNKLFTVCNLLKYYFNKIHVESKLYDTLVCINNNTYNIKERLCINNRDIWILKNSHDGIFTYDDFIVELTPTEIKQLDRNFEKKSNFDAWYIYSDKQYNFIKNIFENVFNETHLSNINQIVPKTTIVC